MSAYTYDEQPSTARKFVACGLGFAAGVCATLAVASVMPAAPTQSSLWASSTGMTRGMNVGTQGPAAAQPQYYTNGMDVNAKRDTYNVKVEVGDNESPEAALRKFTRQFKQSGVLDEVRRRRTFEDTQDIIKRKQRAKGLRKIKERYPPTTMAQYLENRKVINFRAGRPMEESN